MPPVPDRPTDALDRLSSLFPTPTLLPDTAEPPGPVWPTTPPWVPSGGASDLAEPRAIPVGRHAAPPPPLDTPLVAAALPGPGPTHHGVAREEGIPAELRSRHASAAPSPWVDPLAAGDVTDGDAPGRSPFEPAARFAVMDRLDPASPVARIPAPREAAEEIPGGWRSRVPVAWQDARWRVAVGPAAVLVITALVVLAGAGVRLLWGGTGEIEAVSPVTPTAAPMTTAPVVPAAPPTATGAALVVHVVGQVRSPGVVRLPAGSRVTDALAEAGGAAPGAAMAAVNLARPLVDGEQIYVPKPGESPPVAGGPAPSGAAPRGGSAEGSPIDLNAATEADLDALLGIGPVLAGRIVEHRSEIGRYSSVDELGEVDGIGDKVLTRLRPLVRV